MHAQSCWYLREFWNIQMRADNYPIWFRRCVVYEVIGPSSNSRIAFGGSMAIFVFINRQAFYFLIPAPTVFAWNYLQHSTTMSPTTRDMAGDEPQHDGYTLACVLLNNRVPRPWTHILKLVAANRRVRDSFINMGWLQPPCG